VVTDPPYGISYSPAGGGRGFRSKDGRPIPKTFKDAGVLVRGDETPFDPTPVLDLGLPTVLFGGNHYASRLPDSPTWLVWDKRVGLPSNDFADCEMAWSNLGGPARVFPHRWMGLMRDSERGQPRVHPTQKPVTLMVWVIEKCPPGTVLDPFVGSGSTIIAAEQLGRRCYAMDIEPRYVQVAKERWEAFTGKEAVRG
jgi:site-specific DNA-methyltransferase (adenine-specific)/modification methylase